MHGFSELDYEGRIFFKASNALVRLVIMSLSADDASYRCYSDPPISCMDLDKWNPESPLVNFFSLSRSWYSSVETCFKFVHV